MSINLGGNSPKKITMRTASSLPAEYQEVEYIESSGTQYIETSCILQDGYKYKTKLQYTQLGWGNFGGYYSTASNTRFYVGINGENNTWGYGMGNSYGKNLGTPTTGTDYEIEAKLFNGSQYLKVDGNILYSNTFSFLSSDRYPIRVFAGTGDFTGGQWGARAKMYYFQLYDTSNVLALDLVPCYRKADSVIGMYDLVNNVFYTNSGTGTFGKGNDVNLIEKEIKRVTIRPNGTEKQIRPFPFPYTPNANTILYFPFVDDALDYGLNGYVLNTSGTQQAIGRSFNTNLTVNKDFTINNNCCVSFWINVTTANSGTFQACFPPCIGWQCLNVYNQYHPGDGSYWQYYDTSNVEYRVGFFNDRNTWHHVAVSKSGNDLIIYCDGVLKGSVSNFSFHTQTEAGNSLLYMTQSGEVILSDVIYENKARTGTEITNYYNKTKGTYGL